MPPSTSTLRIFKFRQGCVLEPPGVGRGCDTFKGALSSRDIGPDYRTPAGATNPMDDPALVVALVLTGVVLLLGFITALFSGKPWKKPSAKPWTFAPHYLPASATIPASSVTSPRPEFPVIPMDYQPRKIEGCMQADARRMSAPSTTWSQPWRTMENAAASSVQLFSVPEVDEDQEMENKEGIEDLAIDPGPSRERWTEKQDSDVSHETERTEIEQELFDPAPSLSQSSVTSVEDSGDFSEEDEEADPDDTDEPEVFEVKRGQTQSLELVKGVLLVMPPESSSEKNIKNMLLPTAEASNHICRSRTLPNIQVQHSSTTAQPPVPALIVTQPSTLSLFTMGSSTSEMSIDIGKFPLPPLHLEPTVFWRKLEEEINLNLRVPIRTP